MSGLSRTKSHNHGVLFARFARRTATPLRYAAAAHTERWPALGRLMDYEWDPKKEAENLRTHGVSFLEAASTFYDPLSLTADDPDDSVGERCFMLLDQSQAGRLLAVSHADRGGGIRIISAQPASRSDVKTYEP